MNLNDLTVIDNEKIALDDLFFSAENKASLLQIIKEHQYVDELKKYNLKVDNKILLHGSSGCGKTTTAKAIANTLNKKIIIVNLSTVIDSRIGETSKNLKAIFDRAILEKLFYFWMNLIKLEKAETATIKMWAK